MTTTCTTVCNSSTTAASAAATVQAISDRRVADAVNAAACNIDGAARREERHVFIDDAVAGLSSSERLQVLTTLKGRGFDVNPYGSTLLMNRIDW